MFTIYTIGGILYILVDSDPTEHDKTVAIAFDEF